MALLYCDSFDHYASPSQKWPYYGVDGAYNSDLLINTSVKRTGRASLQCGSATGDNNGCMVSTSIPATSTIIMGAALRWVTLNTGGASYALALVAWDGSAEQISVGWRWDGFLTVNRNRSVELARWDTPLVTGVWYYIEAKFTVGTSGSYEVRVNGETVMSGTGNTSHTGNNTVNRVGIGGNNGGFVNDRCAFRGYADDFYACDATGAYNDDFLGDIKVEAILPSGAGSNTEWVPSAGSNYACVDEVTPNGDTDYVYSGSAGSTDTYTYANLTTATGTVKGIQWVGQVRKDDAGTRLIAPVYLPPGGTETAGASTSIPTSYTYVKAISEENPYTELPWTIDDINGAEFGIKVAS